MLHDVTEDQLSLAARVTGIDHAADVLAFQQFGQELEPVFCAFDGLEVKMRRDYRKVCK